MKHLTVTSRFTELSANIYNQDELNAWLLSLKSEQADAKLRKWVDTVLRKYMLNKYPGYVKVTRVKDDDPAWVHKAVEDDTLVSIDFSRPHMRDFTDYINDALLYLATVPDPQRVSVTQALDGGMDLVEKKTITDNKPDGETKIIYDFSNGWNWKSLLDAKAIKREGKLMHHCTGNKTETYIQRVGAKQTELWSLRDPSNKPHCTIEYSVMMKKVLQIKGKQNAPVVSRYQPYVIKFLQSNGIEINKRELLNIGILDVGGDWYNVYELPDNLEIEGDLNLKDAPMFSLPTGLHVKGNLEMEGAKLPSLPDGLVVDGTCDLSNTYMETLPTALKVGLDLLLGGAEVTKLPNFLHVGRHLNLAQSSVKELPPNLYVGGTLSLFGSWVTEIPDSPNIEIHRLRAPETMLIPKGIKIGALLSYAAKSN